MTGAPLLPGMEERWVTVREGRIRYLTGGSGSPLVLLHGIVASSFSFRLNCAELGRHYRLYVPDLRVADADGSLRATADRLKDFLDQAEIAQANIVGSSHGGALAMELASVAPERFQQMILVSPANPFATKYKKILKFYLSRTGGTFVRIAPLLPVALWDYGVGRMYADPRRMPAGTGHGYRMPLRARGMTQHILSSLRTFNDDVEALRPSLARIATIRTLLIWGDRDSVVELASGYRLQQALGAEMKVMPGTGHLPYEESPAEFNRVVLEYLQR
jgi:pimeloyl-ACP methyl ester carboxylesterase